MDSDHRLPTWSRGRRDDPRVGVSPRVRHVGVRNDIFVHSPEPVSVPMRVPTFLEKVLPRLMTLTLGLFYLLVPFRQYVITLV